MGDLGNLEDQLEKRRQELASVNDKLSSILGHAGNRRGKRPFDDRRGSRRDSRDGRDGRDNKRRAVDDSMNDDDDDDGQPTNRIRSSIIDDRGRDLNAPRRRPPPREHRPPTDRDKRRNSDDTAQGRKRSARMFNFLNQTLASAQKDSQKTKSQIRLEEVAKKHEEKSQQEREEFKEQRQALIEQRKQAREQVWALEREVTVRECQEDWDKNRESLSNFIRTQSDPPIFYMPVSHNDETTKRLEESRKVVSQRPVLDAPAPAKDTEEEANGADAAAVPAKEEASDAKEGEDNKSAVEE